MFYEVTSYINHKYNECIQSKICDKPGYIFRTSLSNLWDRQTHYSV